jgi:uncharacterized surface protein with fasciclin (FAS1) repeats
MIKNLKSIFVGLFLVLATVSNAQTKDVVEVAMASKDHSTLVAAIKAADLVTTLKGKGPFTVFAPANSAFNKLPNGTLDTLLKPQNKADLVNLLKYHVVAGNMNAAAIVAAIKAGKGKAVLKTIQGETLTATIENGKVILTDSKGRKAMVTATDLGASNGVIHVIDTVIMPK